MTDDVIAKSVAEATIHAPLGAIDLTEWVFTLTDSEYQACSKNHIAAAVTLAPEGKRMSINVEHVGNLMVHHYVEDVAQRSRCRLRSLSESIGPNIGSGVKVVVTWMFVADEIDSGDNAVHQQRRSPLSARLSRSPAETRRALRQGERGRTAGVEGPQCRGNTAIRQGH